MKLISCYITGFGTIKEWSYDFSDGMNALCQENGWGKTTFSVFLKAMFYGMDYSARTKMLTERKHYMPWDGGVCGGYLIFEIGCDQAEDVTGSAIGSSVVLARRIRMTPLL